MKKMVVMAVGMAFAMQSAQAMFTKHLQDMIISNPGKTALATAAVLGAGAIAYKYRQKIQKTGAKLLDDGQLEKFALIAGYGIRAGTIRASILFPSVKPILDCSAGILGLFALTSYLYKARIVNLEFIKTYYCKHATEQPASDIVCQWAHHILRETIDNGHDVIIKVRSDATMSAQSSTPRTISINPYFENKLQSELLADKEGTDYDKNSLHRSAFVLKHEAGHLYYDDSANYEPSLSTSRTIESRADDFAISHATDEELKAIFKYLAGHSISARYEYYLMSFNPSRTHPSPLRVIRNIEGELERRKKLRSIYNPQEDAFIKKGLLEHGTQLTLEQKMEINTGTKLLQFSADGKKLITLSKHSKQNALKIWDATTGDCLQTISINNSKVDSITLDREEQTIITGSKSMFFTAWDIKTGTCIRTLNFSDAERTDYIFTPNGKNVLLFNKKGCMHPFELGDLKSGTRKSITEKNWLHNLKGFSSNKKRLLISAPINCFFVYDLETLDYIGKSKYLHLMPKNTGPVGQEFSNSYADIDATLNTDGTKILVIKKTTVEEFDVTTGEFLGEKPYTPDIQNENSNNNANTILTNAINALTFKPDPKELLGIL